MTAGDKLAIGDAEALLRAERAGDGLHVVQLAGREARWMAEGARAAADAGADIIDINMGCPAKKVTGGYSGSALMRVMSTPGTWYSCERERLWLPRSTRQPSQ